MGLFKSKYEQALDLIIEKIEMNMSNNYKDNAQEGLKEFEETLRAFTDDGKLKEKSVQKYESILGILKERMRGFTHKDQKPYWT